MSFSPITAILDELRAGRMVVLTDDENRENEGDLVLPAQFITPEAVSFMLREAMGYMCLSLTEKDCDRLGLAPQAAANTSVRGTAFTVSIDGHPRHGFTTGVSAKERARCIQMAIDPAYTAADFVRPGHINPLRSRDGGVLVRTGQTEGSVDLCRLAGLTPAAVIIEIAREDGEMARLPDLEKFCAKHSMKMCSVAQIIEHRFARESLVRRLDPVQGRPVRTPAGEFTAIAFESMVDPMPHLALVVGDVGRLDASGRVIESPEPALVRMHRRNILGDIFDELDPQGAGANPGAGAQSSGQVLRASMKEIYKAGRGAVVYLRSMHSPASDLDAVLNTWRGNGSEDAAEMARVAQPMALREFGIGGQILRQLGLSRLRVLTNRPKAMPGLEAFGLEVVGVEPLPTQT